MPTLGMSKQDRCRLSLEAEMTVQTGTALALKEWGAVIDAMQRGLQVVTLRKGGIREKSFLVQGRS